MSNKKKITNINARADEELIHECHHDPFICNEGLKSEIRIMRCIDIFSKIAEGQGLSYDDFCEVFERLLHYYENYASINGIVPENIGVVPAVMFDDFEE